MLELLIIADDITGALDTGVQFKLQGAPTLVVTNPHIEYDSLADDVRVLVLDAETRHLAAPEAGNVVKTVVKEALQAGVPNIYKKTDSALRGNIGAELAAMCHAVGSGVHFIPAFPQIGRITKAGIQYIKNVSVADSVFGKDPFEPVKHSAVAEIISEQTDIPVKVVEVSSPEVIFKSEEKGILVYDCTTQQQLETIAKGLKQNDKLHFCAGCAGFASVLPSLLGLKGAKPLKPQLSPQLFVACGSVNPITVAQLDKAERDGVPRVRLNASQKIKGVWADSREAQAALLDWKEKIHSNGALIVDSNDLPGHTTALDYSSQHGLDLHQLRTKISATMGNLTKKLLDLGVEATLMITGGDTLLGFMQQIDTHHLTPICEVFPGVVLSSTHYAGKQYYIISKSGGFGGDNLIADLRTYISNK